MSSDLLTSQLGSVATSNVKLNKIESGTTKDDGGNTIPANLEIISGKDIIIKSADASGQVTFEGGDARVLNNMDVVGDLTLTDKVEILQETYQSETHGAIKSLNGHLVLKGQTSSDEVIVKDSTLVAHPVDTGVAFKVRGPGDALGTTQKNLNFQIKTDDVYNTGTGDGINNTRALVEPDSGVDLELAASNGQLRISGDRSASSNVRFGSATDFKFHPGVASKGANAATRFEITTLGQVDATAAESLKSSIVLQTASADPANNSDLYLAGNGTTTKMIAVSSTATAAKLTTLSGDLLLDSQTGVVNVNNYSFNSSNGVISRSGTSMENSKIEFAPNNIGDTNALQISIAHPDSTYDGAQPTGSSSFDASAWDMTVGTKAGDLRLQAASQIVHANTYTFNGADGTISNSSADISLAPFASTSFLKVMKKDATSHIKISTGSTEAGINPNLYITSAGQSVFLNSLEINDGTLKHAQALKFSGNNASNFLTIGTTNGQSTGEIMISTLKPAESLVDADLHLTSQSGDVYLNNLKVNASTIESTATSGEPAPISLKGSASTNSVDIGRDGTNAKITTSAGKLVITSAEANNTVSINDLDFSASTVSSVGDIDFKPSGAQHILRLSKSATGANPVITTVSGVADVYPDLSLRSASNKIVLNDNLEVIKNTNNITVNSKNTLTIQSANNYVDVQGIRMHNTGKIQALGSSNLELETTAADGVIDVLSNLQLSTGTLTTPAGVDLTLLPGSGVLNLSNSIQVESRTISASVAGGLQLRGHTTGHSLKVSTVDNTSAGDVLVTTTGSSLNITSANRTVNISDAAGTVNVSGLVVQNNRLHGNGTAFLLSKDSTGNAVQIDKTVNNEALITTNAGDLSISGATNVVKIGGDSGVTFTKDADNNGVIFSTAASSTLKLAAYGGSATAALEIKNSSNNLELTTANNFNITSATDKDINIVSNGNLVLDGKSSTQVKSEGDIELIPSFVDSSTSKIVISKTSAQDSDVKVTTSSGNLNITSATGIVNFDNLQMQSNGATDASIIANNGKLLFSSSTGSTLVEDIEFTNLGQIKTRSTQMKINSQVGTILAESDVELGTGVLTNSAGNLSIQPATSITEIQNSAGTRGILIDSSAAGKVEIKTKDTSDKLHLVPKNNANQALVIDANADNECVVSTSGTSNLNITSASNIVKIGTAVDSEIKFANDTVVIKGNETLTDTTTGTVIKSGSGDLVLSGATSSNYVRVESAGIKTNLIESLTENLTLKAPSGKKVVIDGNLEIKGTVNQFNQDQLNVEDKVLRLAHHTTGSDVTFTVTADPPSDSVTFDPTFESLPESSAGDLKLYSGRKYAFTLPNADYVLFVQKRTDAGGVAGTPVNHAVVVDGSSASFFVDDFAVGSGNTDVYIVTLSEASAQITDKTFTFTAITNITQTDVANDGAGIEVAGDPANEKSIKWRNNAGYGAADTNDQPYWEVKGGSLLLTRQIPRSVHKRPDGNGGYVNVSGNAGDTDLEVSYSFRIADNEALEVVKVQGHAPGAGPQPHRSLGNQALNLIVATFEANSA